MRRHLRDLGLPMRAARAAALHDLISQVPAPGSGRWSCPKRRGTGPCHMSATGQVSTDHPAFGEPAIRLERS